MLNSRNYRTGIRLVGNTTLTGSVLGDLQSYTVDGKLYYNNGTTNDPVLTGSSSNVITNKQLDATTVFFINTSDPTIQFHFDALGTTGTKTTIISSQTVNRILTLPDATDTIVGRATIDTLTNKSISGSTNTITNISLTSSVSGVLPISNGGSGQTTASASFNALSPMTTAGDIIIGGVSGSGTRLAATTNGFVLTLVGGSPAWVASGSGVTDINGLSGSITLAAGTGITLVPVGNTITINASGSLTNPMTTGGDLIYGGASGVPTRLANGSSGQVLTSAGGTSAPTWTTPSTISGLTTDGVVYAASSSTVASTAVGNAGEVLTSNGTGLAPTFQVASGGNPFDRFASSQVTTNSSSISGSSFATFSNSPSFNFTPNFTGTYKVYCSAPIEDLNNGGAYCRITNTVGSATLLQEQSATIFNPTAGNLFVSILTQSVYTLTASTSYTFEIQGKIDSSNTVILAGLNTPFYLFAERIG